MQNFHQQSKGKDEMWQGSLRVGRFTGFTPGSVHLLYTSDISDKFAIFPPWEPLLSLRSASCRSDSGSQGCFELWDMVSGLSGVMN